MVSSFPGIMGKSVQDMSHLVGAEDLWRVNDRFGVTPDGRSYLQLP